MASFNGNSFWKRIARAWRFARLGFGTEAIEVDPSEFWTWDDAARAWREPTSTRVGYPPSMRRICEHLRAQHFEPHNRDPRYFEFRPVFGRIVETNTQIPFDGIHDTGKPFVGIWSRIKLIDQNTRQHRFKKRNPANGLHQFLSHILPRRSKGEA